MRCRILLSLLITVLIFVIIFIRIDITSFASYMLAINPFILSISMLFIVFTITLNGIRWKYLIRQKYNIGIMKSIKLTLLGFSFNIITPSRLGDFTKAHYLKKENLLDLKSGNSSIIFEKGMDLFALSILALIGIFAMGLTGYFFLILIPVLLMVAFFNIRYLKRISFIMRKERIRKVIVSFCDFFDNIRKDRRLFLSAMGITFLLWFLCIFQVYLFFLCFDLSPSILSVFALVPIAILIGMIPVTFAGMGTRDSAMILLFPGIPAPLVLGVGFLMTLRYIISAIAGLPATRDYINKL